MSARSPRTRSIAVRIMAIGLTGALGIAVIAGSAYFLGTRNSRALLSQSDATTLASKASEIDRLYSAARQDLSDFLRTQQARPADVFGERMQVIATEAGAIAGIPGAETVHLELGQLRNLAVQAKDAMALLAVEAKRIGFDASSGLLGNADRAGSTARARGPRRSAKFGERPGMAPGLGRRRHPAAGIRLYGPPGGGCPRRDGGRDDPLRTPPRILRRRCRRPEDALHRPCRIPQRIRELARKGHRLRARHREAERPAHRRDPGHRCDPSGNGPKGRSRLP